MYCKLIDLVKINLDFAVAWNTARNILLLPIGSTFVKYQLPYIHGHMDFPFSKSPSLKIDTEDKHPVG